MISAERDDLWDYASTTYARPGVAACCLALQDEYRLDVNVLLYCFWLARGESRSVTVDWPRLLEHTRNWQNGVVLRLRRLRRQLKATAVSSQRALFLRDRLIDCELRAEAVEQAALPAWARTSVESSTVTTSSQVAAQHLCAYCRALSMPLDEVLIEALARLLVRVDGVALADARAVLAAAA